MKSTARIQSRNVDKKAPLRRYRCDGCGITRRLHPGLHWHTCGGMEWCLSDVLISASVKAAVATLLTTIKGT